MRRVIPCLLIQKGRLVKTTRFKDPVYLGDPINAVKIYNEKEVDELMILDISASAEGREPDLELIREIASECFMPVCYGGGVQTLKQITSILQTGVEKVAINEAALREPELIRAASEHVGAQSIVVCLDVAKNRFLRGHSLCFRNGKKKVSVSPLTHALNMEAAGAGELLINSVDRDGTLQGYDIPLITEVAEAVRIPVVACGGAGSLSDIEELFSKTRVQAAAAGSIFIYHGPHRAVLITYPVGEKMDRFRFQNV